MGTFPHLGGIRITFGRTPAEIIRSTFQSPPLRTTFAAVLGYEKHFFSKKAQINFDKKVWNKIRKVG
jgi:hypothetical protein